MIACCSPAVQSHEETLTALDMGVNVKSVKNNVQKHIETRETSRLKNMIFLLEKQLDKMGELASTSDKEEDWHALEQEFRKQIAAFRQGKSAS